MDYFFGQRPNGAHELLQELFLAEGAAYIIELESIFRWRVPLSKFVT